MALEMRDEPVDALVRAVAEIDRGGHEQQLEVPRHRHIGLELLALLRGLLELDVPAVIDDLFAERAGAVGLHRRWRQVAGARRAPGHHASQPPSPRMARRA